MDKINIIILEPDNHLSYGTLKTFSGIICFKTAEQCEYGIMRFVEEDACIKIVDKEDDMKRVYKSEIINYPNRRIVVIDSRHVTCKTDTCVPFRIEDTINCIKRCKFT